MTCLGEEVVPFETYLTPSIEVSKMVDYIFAAHLLLQIVREAYMILSLGLHMKEATLSSMTLKVLSLVQRMR